MTERIKVLLGETPPGAVNETALPVGSTVIDLEGDTWYRHSDGWFACADVTDDESVYWLSFLPADYAPYEVTYIPENG